MANYNKVLLVGRLTRDPEFKQVGETNIVSFGLAVDDRKKEASFFDIEAFGKQAEIIRDHMSKGRLILIDGRLKQDKWKDKTSGENRSKVVVVLETFEFLDKSNNQEKEKDKENEQPKQQTNKRRPF